MQSEEKHSNPGYQELGGWARPGKGREGQGRGWEDIVVMEEGRGEI